MKKILTTICLTVMALSEINAIDVKTVRTAGPFKVMEPFVIDSINAAQKKYVAGNILDTPVSLDLVKNGKTMDILPDSATLAKLNAEKKDSVDKSQLMLAGFSFNLSQYTNAWVKVSGPKQYRIYVNGMMHGGKTPLMAGKYNVVVKYIPDTTRLAISVIADNEKALTIPRQEDAASQLRPFSMADNMLMRHYSDVRVSASGKYAFVSNSWFETDGRTQYKTTLIETATGKELRQVNHGMVWMPRSDRYYYTRRVEGRTQLVCEDPLTLREEILSGNLPDGTITMSPDETYVILSKREEGPKKENGVYEILNPDDRQPGWRTRTSLAKIDIASGLVQPLTYSDNNVWLMDISNDGKHIIFGVRTQDLSSRPTDRTTVYRMDVNTLETEKLIENDGFINDVTLIPGTEKMAVIGSAEALGGIGRNLPEGMTPNSFEHQLFIFDLNTKKIDAVTKYFNPSVTSLVAASPTTVYFTAENADSISLYRLDMKNGKINNVKQPCEVIQKCVLSQNGSTLLYYGSGACTAPRLYCLATKTQKVTEIGNVNAKRMAEIQLGTCQGWRFKSEKGYELTGHVYLPANMNAEKKYPMIVHYYGGCSPTSRRFGGGSHYPAHYWNSLGYVVLIVNPSGASGFGQEWGARHVNTAGEGVAEDIIEATKWYADNNSFVNKDKIGCVSASYGGFMTQLLLTKTDLFACGISHAGISDHTSYWGEGYWGYSYSEVSMANSYPWTRKDLYVDRSPLFNADKIHKPLLFTHGSADTNVPIGESIQMYTALKLLGVPTAFIVVEGENHGIMDYSKRIKWINSMSAWFDKYLKDEPSWWNSIYTPKTL